MSASVNYAIRWCAWAGFIAWEWLAWIAAGFATVMVVAIAAMTVLTAISPKMIQTT